MLVTYAFDFDLSYYLVCTTCSGCKNTECLGATEIDAFLVCACAEAQSDSRANVRAYLCDLSATAGAQHAVKDHAETMRLARQVDRTSAPLPRNTGGHAATPTVADQRAAKRRLDTELRAARKQSNTSHKRLNKPRAPGAVAKRNAAKRKAAEISASHCLRRAQRSLVLTLTISKSQAAALRAQLAVRVDAAYPAAERHPMLRCTARGKPSQAWLLPVGLQCALPEDVVKKIVSRRAWISAWAAAQCLHT